MDDLKRLEGKTVKSIKEDTDSVNSYLIIKFESGGKLNITAYPNGDEGVGQLDIDAKNIELDQIAGKRIQSIEEKFDGENDYIVVNFKQGGQLIVTSFCSGEECTAGLNTSIYMSNDLVEESLDEFMDLMKLLNEEIYSQEKNKYAKFGEYPMSKPQYEDCDEDEEIEETDV